MHERSVGRNTRLRLMFLPLPIRLASSVGKALYRYRHGFKSRTHLNFFPGLIFTTSVHNYEDRFRIQIVFPFNFELLFFIKRISKIAVARYVFHGI